MDDLVEDLELSGDEQWLPCPKCGDKEPGLITEIRYLTAKEAARTRMVSLPRWFKSGRVLCSNLHCEWSEPAGWWNKRVD
jgi:hypothetical protein